MADGMNYNVAFPGHQLAMPPPLVEGQLRRVPADAGAKGSLDQNARDVTAFLAWAADPNLDARKRIGWQVLLYLLVTTLVLYARQAARLERREALGPAAATCRLLLRQWKRCTAPWALVAVTADGPPT